MKVKQLIKALQKMPQNVEVYYAHGDNAEYETAGICFDVKYFKKSQFSEDNITLREDKLVFRDQPEEWVVIRG